jgi:hypothetical protein
MKKEAITVAKITAQVNEELAVYGRQAGRRITSKLVVAVHAAALLRAIQELDGAPNEPMSLIEYQCIFRPTVRPGERIVGCVCSRESRHPII